MEETKPTSMPESTEATSANVLPASYAWRRYFARAFDTSLVMALVMILLLMFSIIAVAIVARSDVQTYIVWVQNLQEVNRFVDAFITAVIWLPVEALFLSTLSWTPGKWIFGLRVRTQTGGKPSYGTALSRAALVLLKGQALTVPLVSLITLFVSYDHLVKSGSMSWDRDMKTSVSYEKLTDLRIAGCVLAVIVWAVVAGWGVIHYLALQQ